MKLALGTAQFGMDYGAFNNQGQPDQDRICSILKFAEQANIKVLDTASAYGASETVLGDAGISDRFGVVSKYPPLQNVSDPVQSLGDHFHQSLGRLKLDNLYGYLFHRADDLLGEQGDVYWRALEKLRDEGLVQRIGISAYHPDEVLELSKRYPLTLVQLPANVLMDWFYQPKYLELFEHPELETHIRSAFLQGFLLSDPEKLSGYHSRWKDVLQRFQNRAEELELSPLQACLSGLMAQDCFDHIIVGVDTLAQLEEITSAVSGPVIAPDAFRDIACNDPALTDPRNWKG